MCAFVSHFHSVCRLQHVGRPLVVVCVEQSLSRKKSVTCGVVRWHKSRTYSMHVCKYVCIEATELPAQQCGSSDISFKQNCKADHIARCAMSDIVLFAVVGTVA